MIDKYIQRGSVSFIKKYDADEIVDLHLMISDDAHPFIFNDYPEERADKIAISLNIR